MRSRFYFLAILLQLFCFSPLLRGEAPLPRTILALYDSRINPDIATTWIHLHAEMPLNHLGLRLRYHDIQQSLPTLTPTDDIRGILTAFLGDGTFSDPATYLKWAIEAMSTGKRFVVMEHPGFFQDKNKHPTPKVYVNKFFRKLGLQFPSNWFSLTYDVAYTEIDQEMLGFERGLPGIVPPYFQLKLASLSAIPHLTVRYAEDPNTDTHLIVTSPSGGFVANGFSLYSQLDSETGKNVKQWILNPFHFFRRAYLTDELPKPDPTTLAGRRIYYSHIDGDGWNNVTHVESYGNRRVLSAEVVMKEAIIPYPDLPVTLGSIAADLDLSWVGSKESQRIAREFFRLHQVESGSHTYSHPFNWDFFSDANPDKERPYLSRYKTGRWDHGKLNTLFRYFRSNNFDAGEMYGGAIDDSDYFVPRAYANLPFDINLEVTGSAQYISQFSPKEKPVKVLMWSGNTKPFEGALAKVRESGLRQINGGDTRFDEEYPSYLWVAPLGRQVGDEQQIYASNSNENTYTELWTARYYGFRYLTTTFERTNVPIRLKPMNIYYHLYSGERQASLNSLLSNLDYARSQEIIPIETSHYIDIATGFYQTQFEPLGSDRWRIKDRGRLQTIRFDHCSTRAVDFSHSVGIAGQAHFQGSLYVYLDEKIPSPIIALHDYEEIDKSPSAPVPYLISSRWPVWELQRTPEGFRYQAKGYGEATMKWYVPFDGPYTIELSNNDRPIQRAATDNLLTITIPPTWEKVWVSVKRGKDL